MKQYTLSAITLLLMASLVAALGACSSSSTPTEADGISSLKGIDGAFDESGEEGIHLDEWEDNHQGTPVGELGGCVDCHADTSVDEAGCLPCHDGGDVEQSTHGEGWEDDHQNSLPDQLAACVGCHADTSVDEEGCLPCHTADDDDDADEEEGEEEED